MMALRGHTHRDLSCFIFSILSSRESWPDARVKKLSYEVSGSVNLTIFLYFIVVFPQLLADSLPLCFI